MSTAERAAPVQRPSLSSQAQRDLLSRIGNTPLLPLRRILANAPDVSLWAKWEGANPSGSLKDRIVQRIVSDALADGSLTPDMTVVEASSGNTGIAMGMVGALTGLKMRVYMPVTKSLERRRLMRFWGVDLHLTSGDDPNSHIHTAEALVRDHPEEFFYLNQNGCQGNVVAHAEGTAAEIYDQTDGQVDVVIAALGTSGTIMGLATWFREHKPGVRIVSVEPAQAQSRIEGLLFVSPDYVPPIYDPELVDETLHIADEDAIATARQLAVREGLFCGISSGACMAAARQLAPGLAGKCVVAVLGDRGDRYLSTDLFKGIED